MGRPRLSKEREQSAVGRRRGERKEGWDERPRGSGGDAPVYAEPSAAPAPKAKLAEREPAPPAWMGGSRWSGRAIGVVADGTGRARVSSRLEEVGDYSRNSIKPAAPPAGSHTPGGEG